MIRCRDCSLYSVDMTKDSAGRVRRGGTAPCNWIGKEIYPASVRAWNVPKPTWMSPNDGAGCPTFIRRPTVKATTP